MVVHQIINQTLPRNGAERIALVLHHGLRDRGIDAKLVSFTSFPEPETEHMKSFHLASPYSPYAFTRIANYIRKNCSPDDVIHTHLFPANLYTSLAVRFTRWKGQLITTEHSTSNRRRSAQFGKQLDQLTYSKYDRVFCISNGTRDSLAKWQPGLADRLAVIENGAELRCEHIPCRQPKKTPRIVSAGRLHSLKNYETALKAISQLDDLQFEYQIAGEGPERGALEGLVDELSLGGKVTFLGQVEDVASLLKSADIFLISSRWEGFGLAAVEAMNAGLPVVASDVDGLREVVGDDATCAILVDPHDPNSIAAALRKLLPDFETRQAMGENGFQRATQFSAARMIANYQSAYESLLAENGFGNNESQVESQH